MAAFIYALKSISRRKLKNLSLVLAISIGVTMLVAAQIANTGIINVFSKSSLDGLGKTDITIANPTNEIGLMPENITDVIKENQELVNNKINYLAPSIRYRLPVYEPNEAQFERSVFINGIYPTIDGYKPFFDLDDKKIDLPNSLNNNSVIISSSLAERFEIGEKDPIIISVPNGLGNFTQIQLAVSEIYNDTAGRGIEGVFPPKTNEFQVYVHIDVLRSNLIPSFRDTVNKIAISLKDNLVDRDVEQFDPINDEFPGKEEIEEVIETLQPKISEVLPTASVRSQRIELLSTLDDQIERFTITNNTFIILINLTALLLIINVQSMSIDDRKDQTAVLRTLGNSKKTIMKIFLYETIIIGLLGSILAIGLGFYMGNWIQNTINSIFGLSGISPVLEPQTMIIAIVFGITLASITAIVPTLRVINQPISDALRGIDSEEDEGMQFDIRKIAFLFLVISTMGLVFIGEFWTKAAWDTYQNQLIISILLIIFLTGFFLLTAKYIHRRLSLTFWGASFIGIAEFNRQVSFYYVSNPDLPNIVNWFLAFMFFSLIGTIVVVAANFDLLMRLLEKSLFFSKKLRATIQGSIAQLIDKRVRMILIFSILTVILVISLFFSSLAVSERQGLINQFEWRSQGVNIVVDVQAPLPGIQQTLEGIDGVEDVFAFKKSQLTVYTDDPSGDHFDPQKDTVYRKSVIQVSEKSLKPNDKWDTNSLPLSVFTVDDNLDYEYTADMSPKQVTDLSEEILDDFFGNKTIQQPVIHTDDEGNEIEDDQQLVRMGLGGFRTGFYNDLIDRTIYLQGINRTIPMGIAAGMVDMMGDATGFGDVVMVPPDIANQIQSLSQLSHPNLFLIRTDASYFDDEKNTAIAQSIENTLNNLDPQKNPLCGSFCPLIGASTRLVHDEIKQVFELDSQTWTFFATFSFFALIIGVVGMIIIAIRSVGERTREIGMQRAIGFTKKSVIASLALELLVVVILGIITGVFNAIVNVNFFARNIYRTEPVYPIFTIAINIGLVFVASLIAGIVPAYRASKIPPSEALRYTG